MRTGLRAGLKTGLKAGPTTGPSPSDRACVATASGRAPTGAVGGRLGRGVAAAVLLALLLAPATALADGKYTAARKCGRGAAGVFLGILEIPGNMVEETHENGPMRGMTIGFLKGIGMMVTRELVGLYELLSSPFPLPEDFKPIIEPEFPWSYFEDESDERSTSDDMYRSY